MSLFSLMRLRPLISSFISVSGKSRTIATGSRVLPRIFPSTGFVTIPATEKHEEEKWPWYRPGSFYPVRIGDVLHSRYQVLYKLGYGTTSTVWMCRDLDHNTYVCIKSMVFDYPSVKREIKAYESLSKALSTDPSFPQGRLRIPLDHFHLRLNGLEHKYHFLVHEPLGIDMDELLSILRGRFPFDALSDFARDFLQVLKAVHSAGIVHTDIQPNNILFRIQDETIFQEIEEDERTKHPSARRITPLSSIFATKTYGAPSARLFGNKSTSVLCDFGEARILPARTGPEGGLEGKGRYLPPEMIQPPPYRAPEVLLGLPWGAPVDIWGFGCMLWSFATGDPMLFPIPRSRTDSTIEQLKGDRSQLTLMSMLLGPPPKALLNTSNALEFFNEDGSPKHNITVPLDEQTLEARLQLASILAIERSGWPMTLTPDEAREFLAFIRRVLVWDQEKRPSAAELLEDPWINQQR